MLAFLVRRLFGAILVLIAVSFITYLIFIKIPGGDPAQRIAGRTATQQNIEDIRQKLLTVPGIHEADVHVLFDPPWSRSMMSDAAKLQLGMM